jgi:hypothetical protein
MRNKRVATVIGSLLLGGFLFAASPYATVVYAEGNSFSLIRGGKSVTVKVDDAATIGMEIARGDIIRTASGTFLEIAIEPISASVQIAENTSFRCDADSTGTQSTGELYYGRVRAKVAKLGGSSSFKISSPSLVAGVRGTDFGLDVIAVRPSKTGSPAVAATPSAPVSPMLFRVFCFEGSVLVGSAAGTISDTLILGNNEMVESVAASGGQKAAESAVPLSKTAVSVDVVDFWKVHPFAVISRLPKPVTAVAESAPPSDALDVTPKDQQKVRNMRVPRAAAIALIGLGSVACFTAGVYRNEIDADARFIDPLFAAGGVMFGSGMALGLVTLMAE